MNALAVVVAVALQAKWVYFSGSVERFRTALGITVPITVLTEQPKDEGWAAWAYIGSGGYRIAVDYPYLQRSSYAEALALAAHEMCHIANGDVDRFADATPIEIAQMNYRSSPEHMAVYRCMRGLLPCDVYRNYLKSRHITRPK